MQETPDIADYASESDSENDDLPFEKLTEVLRKPEYQNILDQRPAIGKAEILFAVVKFGLTYCLPFAAMADLLKMINTFFGNKILPKTKYFISKLFSPKDGMTMHALCPKCKRYLKNLMKRSRS